MRRYTIIMILLLILAVFIALVITPWNRMRYYENFEKGFGDWVADADVPSDPNNPGSPVAWSVSLDSTLAANSTYSLKFFIDGRQGDEAAWIERKIPLAANSTVNVLVTFKLYSETASVNPLAVACAYVGLDNPENESQFAIVGNTNEVAGWKVYSYTTTIMLRDKVEAWVAVGIKVRCKTEMVFNIDDVVIVTY
jgi:hypothetical protein